MSNGELFGLEFEMIGTDELFGRDSEIPLLGLTRKGYSYAAKHQGAVALGTWCLPAEEDARIGQTVVPYHWDIPGKRETDYGLLQEFYADFVNAVSDSLNEVHGTTYPTKYWETVVGACSVLIVSAAFDRWHCGSEFMKIFSEGLVVVTSSRSQLPPRSYSELSRRLASDELLNEQLFVRGLARQGESLKFLRADFSDPLGALATTDDSATSEPTMARGPKNLLRHRIWHALGLRPRSYVFNNSYMPKRRLAFLQLLLGEAPTLNWAPISTLPPRSSLVADPLRVRFGQLMVTRAGDFADGWQRFTVELAAHLLPTTAIEDWGRLRIAAASSALNPRVVVSSVGHWVDEPFKVWLADMQLSEGVTIVLAEHGGGLGTPQYDFGFEERIATLQVQNTAPASNRLALPQPKHWRIGNKRRDRLSIAKRRRKDLLVVPFYGTDFAVRASASAQGSQWRITADLAASFISRFDSTLSTAVKIKTHPSRRRLDSDEVLSRITEKTTTPVRSTNIALAKALRTSRMVVCTYPQTAYLECVLRGVPTILIWMPSLFPIADAQVPLIDRMMEDGMVHVEADSAARFVQKIWPDPQAWWNSAGVSRARHDLLSEHLEVTHDAILRWRKELDSVRNTRKILPSNPELMG